MGLIKLEEYLVNEIPYDSRMVSFVLINFALFVIDIVPILPSYYL